MGRVSKWIAKQTSSPADLRQARTRAKTIRMKTDPIRELLRTMPFVPFDLHLANGKVIHIQHPDFASLEPGGRVMIVWKQSGGGFELIDVLLVNSVSVALPVEAGT